MTVPPEIGKQACARVDDDMAKDLAVLMSKGASLTDVLRWCVAVGANLCESAWSNGYPAGHFPVVISTEIEPHPNTPQQEVLPHA